MSTYYHGVRIQENPTSLSSPATNEAGVPVIFGTAPVNLVSDPEAAVNTLYLCSTFAEAKAALGYSEDYESYTLCQAMDAFFKAFAVGPIVLCNVLDPSKHSSSFEETLVIEDDQATCTTFGIIADGVVVKDADEETLTLDTDYTLEFDDDGYLVVTFLTEVSGATISGKVLDASKVSASTVVGSYDTETGEETGLELVRQVYPKFGYVPSLLLAPGWSHIPAVGLALSEKCEDINGLFTCECVIDLDTEEATKYTDAPTVKTESGYFSKHAICVWPMVKYAGLVMYYSALYAALATYTDSENDSVPYLYPSNKATRASAAVLKDGTEVLLDDTQANTLNAEGIVTMINHGYFVAWGNNTAIYPTSTDPKDRWIACRRFFSWWGNNFILNYMDKVDSPANLRLIQSIVDSENVRGNALVSQGKCAGIRIEFREDDNTKETLLDGKVVFRQYLSPYPPAEDILNILEFDPDMIETAIFGGDEE